MIIDFRALYFKVGEEPFISLERISLLFDIDFEDNEFSEQGIHVDHFLPFLEQCGWKIDIIKPSEIDDNIKFILTQKRIEDDYQEV